MSTSVLKVVRLRITVHGNREQRNPTQKSDGKSRHEGFEMTIIFSNFPPHPHHQFYVLRLSRTEPTTDYKTERLFKSP